MTFHEGQRSSGATICAKMGIFDENRNFFSHYGGCMNESGHAYRKDIGLVCCVMFAHLTEFIGNMVQVRHLAVLLSCSPDRHVRANLTIPVLFKHRDSQILL